MGTNYPAGLDSWANPGPNDFEDNPSYYHDVMHGNAYDAIEAIETELGTTPSGTYSTVKDRLDYSDSLVESNYVNVAYGSPLYADEFNSGTMDSGWTIVYPTGKQANLSWYQERHAVVGVHTTGSDGAGAMHAMLRPMPRTAQAGDAVSTAFKIVSPWSNYTMIGVGFTNGTTWGTSNLVQAHWYHSDNNVRINANPGMNGDASSGGSSLNLLIPAPVHIRCVMTAANTWRADISYDSVRWQTFNSYSYTMTPTHMGLVLSNWNSANPSTVYFDYFRMYEGVS